jgi:hypothetical protein
MINLLGTVLSTVINAVINTLHNKKNIENQVKMSKKLYYDKLLTSLPTSDIIQTQLDFLDSKFIKHAIFKRFVYADRDYKYITGKLKKYMNEYQKKQYDKYLDYWEKANDNIERFISSGEFNAVKSNCDYNVIEAYYNFVDAFRNEHNYCFGELIDTDKLLSLLEKLDIEIKKALKC